MHCGSPTVLLCVFVVKCIVATSVSWPKPTVVDVLPHDSSAFTQGLLYKDGFLYESTGLYGRSTVRKVDIPTGEVLKSVPLDNKYFGEGLTLLNNQLVQIVWKRMKVFFYNFDTFAKERDVAQPTTIRNEGWGLCTDGTQLIAR